MKSTFVKQTLDSNLAERVCVVCGAASHPFGYVNKGDAQVCSKACDETYNARCRHESFDEAVRTVRPVA
jgi:uncharacterized CHY-type Zn-finger protein